MTPVFSHLFLVKTGLWPCVVDFPCPWNTRSNTAASLTCPHLRIHSKCLLCDRSTNSANGASDNWEPSYLGLEERRGVHADVFISPLCCSPSLSLSLSLSYNLSSVPSQRSGPHGTYTQDFSLLLSWYKDSLSLPLSFVLSSFSLHK